MQEWLTRSMPGGGSGVLCAASCVLRPEANGTARRTQDAAHRTFATIRLGLMISPLLFAAALLILILIISFASRAIVFCQYLRTMTGIVLKPSDVRRVYRERGRDGVRELFLDLIIREDLKNGPIEIPTEEAAKR